MSICISAVSLSLSLSPPANPFTITARPLVARIFLSRSARSFSWRTWKRRQRKIYSYIVDGILTIRMSTSTRKRRELLHRIEKYARTRRFFVSKESTFISLFLFIIDHNLYLLKFCRFIEKKRFEYF